MNRSDLKEIVKECLIEIMLEGLDKKSVAAAPPKAEDFDRKKKNEIIERSLKKSHLDHITHGAPAQQRKPQVNPEVVNAFPAGQRDIMQSIFEDTARNTLPKQLSADKNPSRAMSDTNVSDIDPMKIFEGASNWSDIAFAPSKRAV
jgi:hypothetical protein